MTGQTSIVPTNVEGREKFQIALWFLSETQ